VPACLNYRIEDSDHSFSVSGLGVPNRQIHTAIELTDGHADVNQFRRRTSSSRPASGPGPG
jgi:hypothetical protein